MKEEDEKGILDELLSAPNDKIANLRLSFSRISSFIQNGPKVLLKRKKISNDGIKMGKLIDLLLFERIKFKDEYYVGTFTKPTSMLGILADIILEKFEAKDILKYIIVDDNQYEINESFIQSVLDISIHSELWKSTKDIVKRVDKFHNIPFWQYLLFSSESNGKEIITHDELDMAEQVVSVLKTHPHTKEIFADNIGNYYQFEAEFEYNGFNFLSILDMVQVDHKNKTIQARDLKTGAPDESQFLSSVLKYYYYLQAKLYQIAAKEIMKILKIEDYTLLPFEFVYISRFEKVPTVYSISEKWEKAAVEGFTTDRGIRYPGLDETLDTIKWHWDKKVFNGSKVSVEANGQINLNDKFIKISE